MIEYSLTSLLSSHVDDDCQSFKEARYLVEVVRIKLYARCHDIVSSMRTSRSGKLGSLSNTQTSKFKRVSFLCLFSFPLEKEINENYEDFHLNPRRRN